MAKAKKLPSGSWRVLVYDYTDPNGKRRYKSFTAETKKEAEYLAAEYTLKKKNKNKPENMTVGEMIDKYIAAKENVLSPGTVREYKQTRKRSLQDIMNIKAKDITEEIIQISINKEAACHSPKSVRNMYGLLSPALKMFCKESFDITLPQKIKPDICIPNNNDMKKLLHHIENTEIEIPILLAACCSMRRSEICALDYNDFDFHKSTVTINKALVMNENKQWVIKTTKSTSGKRTVIVPPFVLEKILNRKKENKPLISMKPSAITNQFKRTLEKAKIPHFRFHDLRHYYASIMLALGVPDGYAAANMGHSDTRVLREVYQHIMDDKKDEINSSLINFFEHSFK